MKHRGLNQLVCAALINERFRETLLHNPAQAIAAGFMDHTFALTPEERDVVIGIRAQRLEDFAAQVYCWISGNGNEHGPGIRAHSGQNVKGYGGTNGNGRNGHKRNLRDLEPFVELVRLPVAA